MPIRIASLHRQIEKTGAKLHRAMVSRIQLHGADDAPSDQERALMGERRTLKEAQAARRAQAGQPRPKASIVAREAKAPKEPREPKMHKEKAPKPTKAAKPHISRVEKAAKKAEALEAAKRAAKKSAKT